MSDNRERYLLYLDTRDLPAERDEQILAAVALGFRLMVATDRPGKFQYHQIDHILESPVGNYDVAEKQIEEFVTSNGIQLAGILCWKDREVELASRLAARFHLPGHGLVPAQRARDKAETRKTLAALGVNPRYAIVTNRSEFASALTNVGCPSLLKPAGNSGSRGIVRVSDPRDHFLYDEFCTYNNNSSGDMFSYYRGHAVLEEELIGSEHSVAGLAYNGGVHAIAIADKLFEREIFVQYENVIPSQLPEDMQTAIVDLVSRAVVAIGLGNGGFHADIIVDRRGKPYILEIGARLGGEMINSHLIPLAYGGYSPYNQLIKIVTGGTPSLPERMYREAKMRAGARIVRAPRLGVIAQIRGIDSLARHPAVRLVMHTKGAGATVYKPRERFKEYEVVYIIAQCGLRDDMHELLNSLEALIKIEMLSDAVSVAEEKQVPVAPQHISSASTG